MHTSNKPNEAPSPASPALLDQRVPGQSVVTELLVALEKQPQGSTLGRFFGSDPLSPDSRRWYQGALGEIEVGELLARLGPDWTVLHAVPVGSGESDIDHVVIGTPGIFTINTKHHAGKAVWVAGRTLMVSGQKQGHIRNSIHEASRAGKLLSAAVGFNVPVAAVIALVGTNNLRVKEAPIGVTVLTAPQLLRWLGKRPPVLTEAAVAHIAAAAKQPGTWHRAPRETGSPAELQDGFRQVQKGVQAARRRRRTWGFAGMAAMAAATWAAIAALPAILETVLQMMAP